MPTATSSNPELQRILETVGELPASPAVVSSVMGLTSNLDSKITDISNVLAADPSLTAKVLKLSNSSFYGRPKGVISLEEAVLILGFFTVRSIVIATSAHTMYSKNDTDGTRSKLWQHSLSAAVAGRQIATFIKHPLREEVFISALLHDIGKLVLLQRMPEQYREVLDAVAKDQGSFIEIENQILSFNHCDVAAILLEKWSFPTSLTEAIEHHHDPPPSQEDQPIPVAHIVSLGNQMAKLTDVGFSDRKVEDLSELESAKLMSLDQEKLDLIFERFQEFYKIETSIFEGV